MHLLEPCLVPSAAYYSHSKFKSSRLRLLCFHSEPRLRREVRRGGEGLLGSVVRLRGFAEGAQQRRLIGLLGGGAMAMDDAVAEADLADPNPDVGDLFHHYDGLYFRGALAAAGFTAQWRSSSSPPLSRLGFSSSWLLRTS